MNEFKPAPVAPTSILNFVDVAFENLPEELRNKIITSISDLKLESRANIEGQFKGFIEICRGSKTPQMLIIKGEWGEGKTTLFNVYMEKIRNEYPKEIITYTMRMDRILDIFEKKLMDDTRLSTHNKFLASILEDIITQLREDQTPLAYSLRDITKIDTQRDIFKAIKILSENRKHVIFFIDEFEAIIGRKKIINQIDVVDAIIRSIRAIRGGELKKLIENTGVIPHFIFAMTPYAYSEYVHRMGIEFKGWEQRRRYIIELEPLTRNDVEVIIGNLIKNVYFASYVEIEDLFEDKRYVDILFTVSQGNFGALIQSFNLLLATSKRKHKQLFGKDGLVKINADLIIETFTQYKIYTYVGEAEGIDRRLYSEYTSFLERNLKEQKYLDLWKELIASSSILLNTEVNEEDIKILNRALSSKFEKEVISRVDLYPISTELEEQIINILGTDNDNIDKNTLWVSLRRTLVTIGEERYLPLPEYDDTRKRQLGEMLSRILSFSTIITVSPQNVKRLYETLQNYLEKNNRTKLKGYTLSQYMKEWIYPAAPIFLLDFVNPKIAYQLFKKAREELANDPPRMERDIMIFLVNHIPGIELKGNQPVLKYKYGTHVLEVDIAVFVHLYFNESRIDPIKRTVESGRIPIIVAKDSVYNEILRTLEDANILKRAIVIPMPEIRLIPLAVIQEILLKKNRGEIDFEIYTQRLQNKLNEIITSLEIGKEFNELLETLREEGYVIEDLKLVDRRGVDNLISAYFMFLYGGSEFKLEELWENHLKKLSGTLLYGRNVRKPVVMKLDIEKPETLNRYIDSLKANGFITQKPDGTIKIEMSKTESKIVEILREYEDKGKPEVKIDEIRKYFVQISKVGYDVFSEVYLRILEWKGIIKITNNYVRLISSSELDKELEELHSTFKSKKEEILNSKLVKENPVLAHIAMFKDHDVLFIEVNQIEDIIGEYLSVPKVYNLSNAQKKLLIDYLDYVNSVLLEKIKRNIKDIELKSQELLDRIESLKRDLKGIEEFIVELDKDFEISAIEEFRTLSRFEDSIYSILRISKPELIRKMKEDHKTTKKMKKLKTHPVYFAGHIHNYVLYLISSIDDEFGKFEKYIKNDIEDLQKIILKIESSQQKVLEIEEKINELAKNYKIKIEIPSLEYKYKFSTIMSLRELWQSLSGYLSNIETHYEKLENIKDSMDERVRDYKELTRRIEILAKKIKDSESKIRDFDEFASMIQDSSLLGELRSILDPKETTKVISQLNEKLNNTSIVLGKIFNEPDHITSIKRNLEFVENELSEINNKINEGIEKIKQKLNVNITEAESIITFLKELQNKGVVELPDSVVLRYKETEKVIQYLKEILEESNFLEKGILISSRLEELHDKIENIKKDFEKVEKDNLQVRIFKLLMNKPTISLQELFSELSNFPEREVINSVIELEKKECIRSYISLGS